MKKILLSSLLALPFISGATNVSWGLETGTLDSSKVDAGTMYLAYATGSIDWSKFATMSTYNAASLKAVGFDYIAATFAYSATTINTESSVVPSSIGGASGAQNLYTICIDDGAKDVAYATSPSSVSVSTSTMFKSATKLASDFSYAQAVAVPEPFSGSLALLGVGLVALRRRMKKAKKA